MAVAEKIAGGRSESRSPRPFPALSSGQKKFELSGRGLSSRPHCVSVIISKSAKGIYYFFSNKIFFQGVQLLKDEIGRNANDVDDTVVNMIVFITDGKNIEGKSIENVISKI